MEHILTAGEVGERAAYTVISKNQPEVETVVAFHTR